MKSNYKSAEDEEDHEKTTNRCFACNVAVTNCRHCDQCKVDALPVGRRMMLPLHLWKRIFHLNTRARALTSSQSLWYSRFVVVIISIFYFKARRTWRNKTEIKLPTVGASFQPTVDSFVLFQFQGCADA